MPGLNTEFQHEGATYHIQIEDLAPLTEAFDIKIYTGGQILFEKRHPYASVIEGMENQVERNRALISEVRRLAQIMRKGVEMGKITK